LIDDDGRRSPISRLVLNDISPPAVVELMRLKNVHQQRETRSAELERHLRKRAHRRPADDAGVTSRATAPGATPTTRGASPTTPGS
jgi:hypothetical protein